MNKKWLVTTENFWDITQLLDWFTQHDARLELIYEDGEWLLYILEEAKNND